MKRLMMILLVLMCVTGLLLAVGGSLTPVTQTGTTVTRYTNTVWSTLNSIMVVWDTPAANEVSFNIELSSGTVLQVDSQTNAALASYMYIPEGGNLNLGNDWVLIITNVTSGAFTTTINRNDAGR